MQIREDIGIGTGSERRQHILARCFEIDLERKKHAGFGLTHTADPVLAVVTMPVQGFRHQLIVKSEIGDTEFGDFVLHQTIM